MACATPATAQIGGFVPERPDIKNYAAVGVDAGNAALSGLLAFAADGGMRDVSLSPIVILSLSESWHLAGGAIVRERGSRTPLLASVGIAHAW